MKIPLNLLSTALRKEWVEVPALPMSRAAGIGRVRLQEMAGDAFDELWDALTIVEKEVGRLEDTEPRDHKALREARKAHLAAKTAIIEACVIDHDPESFSSEVPKASPGSADGQRLIQMLTDLGFTTREAQEALETGLAKKPFVKAECATFYEKCQPDGLFSINLLVFINRFQHCDTLTPERFWNNKGAPALPSSPVIVRFSNEEASPLDKPKEPPT